MNLGDLITQICTGIDMPETEDQDACRLFLKQQAKLLWDRAMWKDSIAQFTSTIGASGAGMTTALWLPSRGTFVCPAMVDRVIACRLDSRYLNVEDQGVYFRFDREVFDQEGPPTQFHLLSPVVWEFDDTVTFGPHASSGGDSTASYTVRYLDSDEFTISSFTDTFGGENFVTTMRVDSFTKAETTGGIALGTSDNDGFHPLLQLATDDTAAPTRQRIRLVRIPTGDTTIRVLAKVVMPTFEDDADNPPIRSSEDVLIAMTQAAMYRRDHQVGKADAMLNEATAYYQNLFKLETVQQAHNKRIVPDDGFGETNINSGCGMDWDMTSKA